MLTTRYELILSALWICCGLIGCKENPNQVINLNGMQHEVVGQSITSDEKERVSNAIIYIEGKLDRFEKPLTVRFLNKVERSGETAGDKRQWSGRVELGTERNTIEIAQAFKNDSEIRFYVAATRLQELKPTVQSRFVRLGLAHYLRTSDGVDEESYKLRRHFYAKPITKELELEELKIDPDYRDRARAQSWMTIYYLLHVKKLPLKELLEKSFADMPDPIETGKAVEAFLPVERFSEKKR